MNLFKIINVSWDICQALRKMPVSKAFEKFKYLCKIFRRTEREDGLRGLNLNKVMIV